MDHLAVMRKSWGLIPRILNKEKIAESRWYKSKIAPWNKIEVNHNIYFKNTGEPVTVRAKVTEVMQHKISNNKMALKILEKYARKDLGIKKIPSEILNYIKDKKYAVIIFFDKVEKIKPFNIDKTGFGTMTAWITVDNIKKIKKHD